MKLTLKQIKYEYKNWFIQHLISSNIENFDDPSTYFLFTITSPFTALRLYDSNQQASELFSVFDIFYIRLCQNLVGKNFHRRSFARQLPLAVAAIDVEGTKAGHVDERRNPHLHSIVRIPDRDLDRFNETMSDVIGHMNTNRPMWSFHLDEFESPDIQNLDRVAEYLTKFTGQNAQENHVAEDVRTYPLSKEYRKPN